MKVMIVDDNVEMRQLIRTVLAGTATEFVEYSDGEEAVAAFDAERPQWAIMDVVMRAMDGLTATRLIRSRFEDSRIIIVTQFNHPKLRERALAAGANGFLLKEDLVELRSLLATDAESKEPPAKAEPRTLRGPVFDNGDKP